MLTNIVRYARELKRMKPLYDRAALSLSQSIRPDAQIAALIRTARKELTSRHSSSRPLFSRSSYSEETTEQDSGSYVGVHIRRGDRKAESWPNRGTYVPVQDFVKAASDAWTRLIPTSSSVTPRPMTIWLASDSPTARDLFSAFLSSPDSKPDMTNAKLFSLERSEYAELRALSSGKDYVQSEFNSLPLEDRVRLTRGAIVDFALLSGSWDWPGEPMPVASVCTIRFVTFFCLALNFSHYNHSFD